MTTKNAAKTAQMKDTQAAAKKVKARGVEPYKHESKIDPSDPFGLHAESKGVDTTASGVVESGSLSSSTTGDSNMEQTTETAKTKAELDAEKAKAKIAAKEAKMAEAAKRKEEAEARKAEKAKAKADAIAARAAAKEAGQRSEATDSMKTLAERVKSGQYVKGANGQLRSNDELAVFMDTIDPPKTVAFLLAVLGVENTYTHLNYGQQSMNLRNRLRGAMRKDAGPKLADLEKVRDEGGFKFVPPAPKAPKAEEPVAEATA